MKYYMKQKVFSWRDKFNICDEFGRSLYYAESEFFTLGKKLHLYDENGYECAFIRQRLLSLLPEYYFSIDGEDVGCVRKRLSFLHPHYFVYGPDWEVYGSFLEHEYEISYGNMLIASVSKRWLSWGDTYEIDIPDAENEIAVLCIVLIIDACLAAAAAAAAGAASG